VDHHGESPSWLPGTGSVGTGAGPPDLDAADDNQHDDGPVYAAGPGESDAPGFSDVPVSDRGFAPTADAPPPPDFGDAAPSGFDGGAPGFGGEPAAFGGDPSGYGPAQGFGAPPVDAPGLGGAPVDAPGLGGHPGFGAPQAYDVFTPASPPEFGGPAEPAAGFAESQQGQYPGPVTGEFRGDYDSAAGYGPPQDPGFGHAQDAGYGAAPGAGYGAGHDGGYGPAPGAGFAAGPDGGFAAAPEAGLPGGPAVGTMYGEQAYQIGRDNGARPMDQGTPYPSQYPPVEPPRSRMTASLRARRPRFYPGKRHDRPGRQAQLTVGRIEPWSVMKFSFVISLVAFIVLFVAVAVLYAALAGLGVFSALQHSVSNITSSQGSAGFNLGHYLSASRVLGYTGLLGAINVVLITALCTVGAVLYNITANLAGGIEITLKESD
jgi:hypothetical protein